MFKRRALVSSVEIEMTKKSTEAASPDDANDQAQQVNPQKKEPPPDEARSLTRAEVLSLLGISRETLRVLEKKNSGPPFHYLGDSIQKLYPRDKALAWRDARIAETPKLQEQRAEQHANQVKRLPTPEERKARAKAKSGKRGQRS